MAGMAAAAPSTALEEALALVRGRPLEGEPPKHWGFTEYVVSDMTDLISDTAYELARRAYRLDTANKWYHQFYGQALIISNRLDEALKVYRRLLENDPKDPDNYRIVAALYEQGRVVHCGAFPALEEEMMALGSEAAGAKSPDRADALVWALTHLLLVGKTQPRLRAL